MYCTASNFLGGRLRKSGWSNGEGGRARSGLSTRFGLAWAVNQRRGLPLRIAGVSATAAGSQRQQQHGHQAGLHANLLGGTRAQRSARTTTGWRPRTPYSLPLLSSTTTHSAGSRVASDGPAQKGVGVMLRSWVMELHPLAEGCGYGTSPLLPPLVRTQVSARSGRRASPQKNEERNFMQACPMAPPESV